MSATIPDADRPRTNSVDARRPEAAAVATIRGLPRGEARPAAPVRAPTARSSAPELSVSPCCHSHARRAPRTRRWRRRSDALPRLVRPFELHAKAAQGFCLPGANVADLAVRVVIPTLPRHRVGDRLAE